MSVFTFPAAGTSGFGQMAVIGLIAVNQSNLTNGFSCSCTEVHSISVRWYTVRVGKWFNTQEKVVGMKSPCCKSGGVMPLGAHQGDLQWVYPTLTEK